MMLATLAVWSLHIAQLHTIPPPPSCSQLVQPFAARGVSPQHIPATPLSDPGLTVCPAGPSCCSRQVEARLASWSRNTFMDQLFNTTTSMAAELDAKATQVDDYVYILLNKAQRDFHEMFTRTYGVMYQKNAQVFQNYFKDLQVYYDKGVLNPVDSTNSFFNTLYQKMFQVLNGQYSFGVHYLSCVSENMDTLRPFGDVPRKLASSVKRSLVAARALVKALRTGHEIANQMTKVSMSPACVRAVQRMGTCSACQGLPAIPPCPGLCLNVMKGCLAHHYEVTHLWDDYIEALMSLSERLAGPFNVEMTIEPISIKISDAIMNFQESGFQVTQKVFELCGTPRLGKRAALGGSSQFVFEKRLDKSHRPPARPQKSEFERQLIDLRKRLKTAQGFWARVPYQMCPSNDRGQRTSRNLRDLDTCWNGQEPGPYETKVAEDGLAHQIDNPEVPVKIDLSQSNSLLNEQKFRLSNLANVLRSAFRGGDIEWWDQEEEVMEDEGSGAEVFYGEYSDDEDGFGPGGDQREGSGDFGGRGEDAASDAEEDPIIVPAWTQDRGDEKWNPWPKVPATLAPPPRPDTTTARSPSSGTSSVHLRSRLEVARAVVTYLLPVATCFIGSFLTDAPFFY